MDRPVDVAAAVELVLAVAPSMPVLFFFAPISSLLAGMVTIVFCCVCLPLTPVVSLLKLTLTRILSPEAKTSLDGWPVVLLLLPVFVPAVDI